MNALETQSTIPKTSSGHKEGMIWLELTNGCNLHCSHCYSDSFPGSQSRDKLTHDDYMRLVDEAADLEMPTIQFIGGEPLLYKRLPELIQRAQSAGFEQIEIFSNLVADRLDVFDAIDPSKVSFATSVYSDQAFIHDSVVAKVGSFAKTTANITRLVSRGIQVRAGFIEMEANRGQYQRTAEFLRGLGVWSVGYDSVREFGRGGAEQEPCMSSLCGTCAGNTLCVTYEGKVLPCIMSRAWPIGDVFSGSLRELMGHDSTLAVRSQIAEAYRTKSSIHADSCDPFKPICQPGRSGTGRPLPPCEPGGFCSPPCVPNRFPCPPTEGCEPYKYCNPR